MTTETDTQVAQVGVALDVTKLKDAGFNTSLTKGEMIDLMIESATDQLKARLEQLREDLIKLWHSRQEKIYTLFNEEVERLMGQDFIQQSLKSLEEITGKSYCLRFLPNGLSLLPNGLSPGFSQGKESKFIYTPKDILSSHCHFIHLDERFTWPSLLWSELAFYDFPHIWRVESGAEGFTIVMIDASKYLGNQLFKDELSQVLQEAKEQARIIEEEAKTIASQFTQLRSNSRAMRIRFLREIARTSEQGEKILAALDAHSAKMVQKILTQG